MNVEHETVPKIEVSPPALPCSLTGEVSRRPSCLPEGEVNQSSPELSRQIPRLTVAIVNFNTRGLLKNCLDSVLESPCAFPLRVCVVDNGSKDGSSEMVSRGFPSVELIASPENLGFSKANNLVLGRLNTEYALLLNPDILVPKGAIETLVSFMDSNPDVGVLGPKLVRPDGRFDPGSKMGFATVENVVARKLGLARLFPKSRLLAGYHLRYFDENQICDVDAVAGACMMVRKEVVEKVGLFDESFFLGCEDLDYCYRVARTPGLGGEPYRVVYYPEVTVTHLGRRTREKFPLISVPEFHKSAWRLYEKYQAEGQPAWYNQVVKAAIILTGYIRTAVWLTKLLLRRRRP